MSKKSFITVTIESPSGGDTVIDFEVGETNPKTLTEVRQKLEDALRAVKHKALLDVTVCH